MDSSKLKPYRFKIKKQQRVPAKTGVGENVERAEAVKQYTTQVVIKPAVNGQEVPAIAIQESSIFLSSFDAFIDKKKHGLPRMLLAKQPT
jgi:hypothetical protein